MFVESSSPINLYNARACDWLDAGDIMLLQLEEDGLAEEYFDHEKEDQCWRWTAAAYTIKVIAVDVRMTSPVGWVSNWTDEQLPTSKQKPTIAGL
jgi:hypothetical protein